MRRLSSYKNKFGNDWARILSSPVDVVRSEEYKNGKEAGDETEGKSGRVHRGRQKMKRK